MEQNLNPSDLIQTQERLWLESWWALTQTASTEMVTVMVGPINPDASEPRSLSATAAYWDDDQQSFAMVRPGLAHDPDSDSEFKVAGRFGQCVTLDSLLAALSQRGLELAADSLEALYDLGARVEARFGAAQVVGWSGDVRGIALVTPNGTLLEISPAIDHPDYQIDWGTNSASCLETAQLMLDRCLGPVIPCGSNGGGSNEAYHLMVSFLADVEDEWSVGAQSLADWAFVGEPIS